MLSQFAEMVAISFTLVEVLKELVRWEAGSRSFSTSTLVEIDVIIACARIAFWRFFR